MNRDCIGCQTRESIGMAPTADCPHQFAVSVATVVTDPTGLVLMIRRRDNGDWELPGGIIDLDESIADGAVREVAEEAGVVIADVRLVGLQKSPVRMFVRAIFHGVVVAGEPRPSDETTEVAWWTLDDIRSFASADMATAVTDALSTLTGSTAAVRLLSTACRQPVRRAGMSDLKH